jgi:predicted  nucleic acid-binding Zn-ribbon protein
VSASAQWGVALIGSGALAALVTWFGTRKVNDASATEVLVRTSTSLLAPLRDEIAALRRDVLHLRAEVAAAQEETAKCHDERDADRARLEAVEVELARYKAGPNAGYQMPEEGHHE